MRERVSTDDVYEPAKRREKGEVHHPAAIIPPEEGALTIKEHKETVVDIVAPRGGEAPRPHPPLANARMYLTSPMLNLDLWVPHMLCMSNQDKAQALNCRQACGKP